MLLKCDAEESLGRTGAKQVVAHNQQEKNDGNGPKIGGEQEHERHSDSDKKQGISDYTFHRAS